MKQRVMSSWAFKAGVLVSSALVFSISAYAHNGRLKGPNGMVTTSLLPYDVLNPKVKTIFLGSEANFNNQGISTPLAAPLNRNVTWSQVLGTQKSDIQKVLLKSQLDQMNFKLEDSAGSTTGDVQMMASVVAPQISYGVTDRLSVAVAFPIYTVKVNAKAGFVKSNQSQAFVDAASQADPVTAANAAKLLNSAVDQQLAELGYDPIRSKSVTTLGDIKFGGKYLFYRDKMNRLTLAEEVSLPTGRAPNPNDLLDTPTGDGQTDLQTTLAWEYRPHSIVKLTTYGAYTVQTSDKANMRVPLAEGETLSPDLEEVDRDLGDIVSLGTAVEVKTFEFLKLSTGYNFQQMGGASFRGSQFEARRYGYLEALNTKQTLHSASLAAEFTTVDWYRRKEFFAPMKTVFTYSVPIYGKNVPDASVVSAEVVAYF